MQTVLITGSNRGIGLELTKQYANAGWHILACCRHPEQAQDLSALTKQFSQITLLKLDVTSEQSVQQLAANLTVPVDLLILNAGIIDRADLSFKTLTRENLQRTFLTNSIAPIELCKALVNNVAASQSKQIVYISSGWGSITENTDGTCYAYRASKAAGNSLMKTLSVELAPLGIQVLVIHPGWVKTDMGGPNAPLQVQESVAGMRKTIEQLKQKTGVFFDYSGKEVPW